jgi:integrase
VSCFKKDFHGAFRSPGPPSVSDCRGARERGAFVEAANNAEREVRTFCLVLAYAGCRIPEALALTPKSFDFPGRAIVFETLKKRRAGVYRAVPMPQDTLDTIDMVHALQKGGKRKKNGRAEIPLWPRSRTTAFRRVKEVMDAAGISDGPHKCPKGLRHGYGVHAIGSGVPLNMLSKWMGHASQEVTAIYANALGEEQYNIAARMWG